MPEDRNLIQGTVEAVIYQNAENGYTVLKLDAGEGGGVTVVGCLPGVAPGEGLSVSGAWGAPRLLWRTVQGRDGGAADAAGEEGHL